MSSLREKKGRWYIVWWDSTRRRHVTESLSKFRGYPVTARREAERAQKAWDRQHRQDAPGSLTLSRFLDLYIEHSRPRKTAYTQNVDNRRLGAFAAFTGKLALSSLDHRQITRFLDSLTCGATTKNHYRSIIHAACNWGVKVGYLHENPAARTDPLPVYNRKRMDALTDEEVDLVLEFPSPEREFCLLCLWAGLRRADVVYLTWGDIDFDQMTITVNPKPEMGYAPKAARSRGPDVIPLLPELAIELQKIQRRGRFVFDRGHDRPLYAVRTWTGLIGERLREHGITSSIHQLRHTFATNLARAGVNLMALRLIARHSTLTTTVGYVHLRDADLQAEIGKLQRKGRGNEKPE